MFPSGNCEHMLDGWTPPPHLYFHSHKPTTCLIQAVGRYLGRQIGTQVGG